MEACFLPSTGKKQLPAQDKVSLGTQFRKLRLGTRQDMLESGQEMILKCHGWRGGILHGQPKLSH